MTIRPTFDELFMLQAKLVASRSTCNSRPQGAVLVRDKRIIATGYNGALPGQEHCSEQPEMSCPECLFDGEINCKLCHGTALISYCHRRATATPDSQKDRSCVSAHAEANTIAQAARLGMSTKGSILYCTTRPCTPCAKLLAQTGIVQVFYELDYDDPQEGVDLLPMERLIIRQEIVKLAQSMLEPDTSKRRLTKTA